ncbi:fungal hydrophobin-domain-containing protein [Irpex rosettiformis]|uniref:Fungal hydrophobin-domain-containing protein n=1 Tax=Irpex rosettiformis TaxID=378272 RepID=A0ACB8TZR1_9APHY|nr:fungal hydrophobin-domain-containing protein [Irpex rosettiformis]
MFGRVSPLAFFYALFAFSVLAVATPWGAPTTTPPTTTTVTVTAPGTTTTASAGNCNTGPIQCCQSTESSSSAAGNLLLGLLGIVLDGVDVLLGINCSPISVIGVGTGSTCNASPVCCQNNAVGGLISIGCIPITL